MRFEQTLIVSPDQYHQIKELELKCVSYKLVSDNPGFIFDDARWIAGLNKICGKATIDRLKKYVETKLVVNYDL